MENLKNNSALALAFLLLTGCANSGTEQTKQASDADSQTVTVTGQRISREEFMRRGGSVAPTQKTSQETAFDLLKKALDADHYPDIGDYPDCVDLIVRLRQQNIPIESIQPNKVSVLSPRRVALNYQYETDQCLE